MQLLAGFALDRVWIVLEMLDVILQPIVLLLETFYLLMKFAVFDALLLVGCDTVASYDDVVSEEGGENYREGCGNAAADAEEEASEWRFDPDYRFLSAGGHGWLSGSVGSEKKGSSVL